MKSTGYKHILQFCIFTNEICEHDNAQENKKDNDDPVCHRTDTITPNFISKRYMYRELAWYLQISLGKSVRLWCDGSSDRSFMLDPVSYLSFQPVLHDWCNKGCGMVHIKDTLLLIGRSSPCGGSGFPLSLSEWFLTICLTPYNR